MRDEDSGITTSLRLWHGEWPAAGLGDRGKLWYNPLDPFAVTLVYRLGGGMHCRTFARDLLVNGLREVNGEGDVRVGPGIEPRLLRFDLGTPCARVTMHVAAVRIRAFLREVFAAVPNGSELDRIDLHGELEFLLNS